TASQRCDRPIEFCWRQLGAIAFARGCRTKVGPLENLQIARRVPPGRSRVRPSRGNRAPPWSDLTSGEINPLDLVTTKRDRWVFVRQPPPAAGATPAPARDPQSNETRADEQQVDGMVR